MSAVPAAQATGQQATRAVASASRLTVLAACAAAWVALTLAPAHASLLEFSLHWALMSVAMMLPLASRQAELTIRDAAGYLLPWLALAPVAWLLASAVPAVLLLAGAAAWQVAPARRRALLRCPQRAGARGVWCVAACGPLMLAFTVLSMSAHPFGTWAGLLVMAIATVAMALERRSRVMTIEIAMALVVAAAVLAASASDAGVLVDLPASHH